jgi:hypothetical protein
MLILGDPDGNPIDWTSSYYRPTSEKIVNDIVNNKYKLYDTRNSDFYYQGPGFFRFNAALEYRSRPRISNESQTESSIYNSGWHEVTDKGYLDIIKFYKKGNTEVYVQVALGYSLNDNKYSVRISTKEINANGFTSRTDCIDEYGNITEAERIYSKSIALRIINEFIRSH